MMIIIFMGERIGCLSRKKQSARQAEQMLDGCFAHTLGERWLVAYQLVSKYPLMISPAVNENDALIPWRRVAVPMVSVPERTWPTMSTRLSRISRISYNRLSLSVALVLIATVATAHGLISPWIEGLWMLGSATLLLVTVSVVQRWFQPGLTAANFWSVMTPALFIPVVGNVLPALAGVSLGHPLWAAAQYGLAAMLWPVALSLVLVRIGMVGLWPQRLLPATFITIAPPSVLALSGMQLGAADVLVHMLWGVALFFTLVSMTVLKRCLAQPFGMPFWGMSFPLAASAALSLQLASAGEGASAAAMAWLWAVSAVIAGLVCATVRGLWRGQLLQLEPVVAPAAAVSPAV
jgi:tellurite resistance protein